MKFTLYSVGNTKIFKNIQKMIKFMSNEELSVFHYNEINVGLIHVVFNIKDEYLFGTKKSGNQINMPINQYINTFYDTSSKLLFVEHINEKYCDEVRIFLENQKIKVEKFYINNKVMLETTSTLKGFIKKAEFEDVNQESIYYESINEIKLRDIVNEGNIITYLLILVDDIFISLTTKGIVSVSNNDLSYLSEFVKVFKNAEIN